MTKMEYFVDDTTKLIPVTREILFTTELFVMGTNPKHAWAPVEKEKLQTWIKPKNKTDKFTAVSLRIKAFVIHLIIENTEQYAKTLFSCYKKNCCDVEVTGKTIIQGKLFVIVSSSTTDMMK